MKEYYSPKLGMWYAEALKESDPRAYFWWKILRRKPNKSYTIYPRSYWQHAVLDQDKSVSYCFIGGYATDPKTIAARKWLMDFLSEEFNATSYLQFTDQKTKSDYRPLGEFDYTLKRSGFVPKEVPQKQRNQFDENYFTMMAKSQFVLCPAGDAPWSMRFYEALMCRAIPIVESSEHAYRSQQESKLDYKFYLPHEKHIYREDWVEHNYQLFLNHHTFSGVNHV